MNRRIEDVLLLVLKDNAEKSTIEKKVKNFTAVNWQDLGDLATKTGLFAEFYKRLLKLNLTDIPPDFLNRLKNLYLFNLRQNLILQRELFNLLEYFRAGGMAVVPLKGPILARHLYGDVALRRTSCDLDLLVKRERFEEAERILEKAGYVAPETNRDKFYRNYELKHSGQLRFSRHIDDKNNFLVELHWDLRGLFAYAPLEDFWRDLREIDFDGHKILMPSNENLLIYLCLISMTLTEFPEPRYLYDIYTFVKKFGADLKWDTLAAKVVNARYRGPVFFGLALSREFFGFNIPAGFLEDIRPDIFKRLFLKLWINKQNVLYKRPDRSLGWYYFFTTWHYFVTSWLYSKNIIDCIRIIYKKIFLSKEDMAGYYKRSSSKVTPFLYLQRALKPVSHFS